MKSCIFFTWQHCMIIEQLLLPNHKYCHKPFCCYVSQGAKLNIKWLLFYRNEIWTKNALHDLSSWCTVHPIPLFWVNNELRRRSTMYQYNFLFDQKYQKWENHSMWCSSPSIIKKHIRITLILKPQCFLIVGFPRGQRYKSSMCLVF